MQIQAEDVANYLKKMSDSLGDLDEKTEGQLSSQKEREMTPERLYLLSDLATTPRLAIGKHYPLTFFGRRDGNLDRYAGKIPNAKHSVVTVEDAEKSLLRLQRTLRSMFEVIEARLKSIDDYLAEAEEVKAKEAAELILTVAQIRSKKDNCK